MAWQVLCQTYAKWGQNRAENESEIEIVPFQKRSVFTGRKVWK
jgi:hypothetical protein